MPRIDFTDVSLKRESRKIGPGRSRRYAFFRKFMPHVMARRAASTYNISKGVFVAGVLRKPRYYYPELMSALEVIDERVRTGMKLWSVRRGESIKRVWSNLAEDYRSRGVVVEDWQDLYKRWLSDAFEEVSP